MDDRDRNDRMCRAVLDGDAETVREILAAGLDPWGYPGSKHLLIRPDYRKKEHYLWIDITDPSDSEIRRLFLERMRVADPARYLDYWMEHSRD